MVGKKINFCENVQVKLINSSELIKCLKNKSWIILPIRQSFDQQKKVEYIVSQIENNFSDNWLLTYGVIIIGIVKGSVCSFVLKGHDELNSICIYSEKNPSYNLPILIIEKKFNTVDDMNEHFGSINTEVVAEPLHELANYTIIENTLNRIKNWVESEYRNAFRRFDTKIAKGDKNLSINEWIKLFLPAQIKILYDKHNKEYTDVQFLINQITKANNFAKDEYNNIDISGKLSKYISRDRYKKYCVSNQFYLSHKNVMFMDIILDKSNEIIIS